MCLIGGSVYINAIKGITKRINNKIKTPMKTNYSIFGKEPQLKKESKTHFTHVYNENDHVIINKYLIQHWQNVQLLPKKVKFQNEDDSLIYLDQFLVWNDKYRFFILLGIAGSEFDNL